MVIFKWNQEEIKTSASLDTRSQCQNYNSLSSMGSEKIKKFKSQKAVPSTEFYSSSKQNLIDNISNPRISNPIMKNALTWNEQKQKHKSRQIIFRHMRECEEKEKRHI